MASRTISRSSCSFIDFNMVNDADDGGIDRRSLSTNRLGRGAAFDHHQHLFVHPCPDRIDCQQHRSSRRVLQRKWLHKQQLGTLELPVFLRGDDGSNHSCERHGARSQWSTMPTTPASAGTSVGINGKLASFPRTKNTISPTPAPTASTATSVRPTGPPSAPIGCRTSSVRSRRFSSLRVTTT